MSPDPVFQKLLQQMDAAEWLSDDRRSELEALLARYQAVFDEEAADPATTPEELDGMRRGMWQEGLELIENSRKTSAAEDALLAATADLADVSRQAVHEAAKFMHEARKAIEEGTFDGNWDELMALKDRVSEWDDLREEFLHHLTVDDIRRLRGQGLL